MRTVQGRHVANYSAATQPGDYWFSVNKQEEVNHIKFNCPCGCGSILGAKIGVDEFLPAGPLWQWDGNKEAPTITPSIRRIGACEWHGFIKAGIFEWA